MKKIFKNFMTASMIAVLAVTIVACGPKKDKEKEIVSTTTEEPAEETPAEETPEEETQAEETSAETSAEETSAEETSEETSAA